MTDFYVCSLCGSPANVHLTQIMNGKVLKIHLCENCARNKGIMTFKEFLLSEIMTPKIFKITRKKSNSGVFCCPKCQYSIESFKKDGKLGCSECYNHFKILIKQILEKYHKNPIHKGKQPKKSIQRQSTYEQILELESSMQKAVLEERYEDAAKFRDEIKNIKKMVVSN